MHPMKYRCRRCLTNRSSFATAAAAIVHHCGIGERSRHFPRNNKEFVIHAFHAPLNLFTLVYLNL